MAEEKQVEKLERFGLHHDEGHFGMVGCRGGEWVRYSDVLNTLTEQGGERVELASELRAIADCRERAGKITTPKTLRRAADLLEGQGR
jgi:hypothetical protein